MVRTLGVVEIPSRSHEACWPQRRLAGKTLLEWLVRRVGEAQRLDAVVAICSSDDDRNAMSSWIPSDVPLFAHGASDALGAMAATLRAFPCQAAVRVNLAQPLVDPALIDRLVSTGDAYPQCDYIGYCLSDGQPVMKSQIGVFSEWFQSPSLLRAARKASSPADRKEVTRFLYSRPDLFQIRLIPAPPQLDRADVRLALQVEEDWDHVEAILEALGHDEFDWQGIAGLLAHQPHIRHRMAALNEAHSDNAKEWAVS